MSTFPTYVSSFWKQKINPKAQSSFVFYEKLTSVKILHYPWYALKF